MLPFTATHFPTTINGKQGGGEAASQARGEAASEARGKTSAHPYLPGVGGSTFTLLTEWEDLALAVRCVWEPPRSGHAGLGSWQSACEPAAVLLLGGKDRGAHALVSLSSASRAPGPIATADDFFAGLRFAFDRLRAAVLVSIRRGRVVLFQPFANDRAWRCAAFRDWVAGSGGIDAESLVRRYASEKAAACGEAAEAMMPDPSRWWLNGHVVCNVKPANVWGDYQLREYLSLLQRAASMEPTLEVDFLLNRRDAPLLVTPTLSRPGLQILSAYSSSRVGDIPVPLADDWAASFAPRRPPVPLHSRSDLRAVFRGSSTGRGVTSSTNLRLRLCLWACREAGDLFDCRITRVNTRDQLLGGRVVHPEARAIEAELRSAGAWAERMPLEEQARRYRAAVYVRGHQAASRLGALFRLGFLVLALHPEGEDMDAPGWRPWFWHMLRDYSGWKTARRPSELPLPASDEVFCVCASFDELRRCAAMLAKRPDVAGSIASNGAHRIGAQLLSDPTAIARAAADSLCAAAMRTYPRAPSAETHPLFGVTNFEYVAKRSTRLEN